MERPGRTVNTLIAVLLLGLTGCTVTRQAGPRSQPSGSPTTAPPLSLSIAPRTGARDLPVTAEIGTTVRGGTVSSVNLTDAYGKQVDGAPRPDGSSWVPASPLGYGRSYTAVVTAAGPDGHSQTLTTRFSTMPDPGTRRIGTGLYFFSGHTYGVGMPIAVEFDAPVPDRDKASVERRLFVTSDPPQVGVWHWFGDRQVLYRPQNYWQPGTRITVRAALGGLPVGGRLLDRDRGGTATIGPKQVFVVHNSTKSMYVYQNDRLTKTFPVSLGKRSTPTSSGNLVIMSREYVTVFATRLYRITAYYDERITWDGQFLHAAPWSVDSQGRHNVSHGCVNLSVRNAAWVYGVAQVGDPVTITGTEVHVAPGNGWTVWDLSWTDYLKGSALPHPDLDAAAVVDRTDRVPG